MTGIVEDSPEPGQATLALLVEHLTRTGWDQVDGDARTSLWRLAREERLNVILPATQTLSDAGERIRMALRTVAYAERRSLTELTADVTIPGGADTISVRLTPSAPLSGVAPLAMAKIAMNALHDFVLGSASALDTSALVLPSRRPARAESYAERALVSTEPGSFVVNLTLPLVDFDGTTASDDVEFPADLMPSPPARYGRQVVRRMRSVTQQSVALAEEVGAGVRDLKVFAAPRPVMANATELSALAELGSDGDYRYMVRFTQAPSRLESEGALRLTVTPAHQRVLHDAAELLRSGQSRSSNIELTGLVIRLARTGNVGPGEVVVLSVDKSRRGSRRYHMELPEADYNDAVRAHREALTVLAVGHLQVIATRASLSNVTYFSVISPMGG